ncbi:MAG: Crp/Fnr family transcriptional regulator [Flavobacteriales bacterium]
MEMVSEKNHTCMNCLIKQHSLFDELSYKELETLERHRTCIDFGRDETIYKQGTWPVSLFCLNKGHVKITRTARNGNVQILGFKKPVDFLGFQSLMTDEPYATSAVAIDEASVCCINKDDFYEVVSGNNALALGIITYQAKLIREAKERIVAVTQKNMRSRLADGLLLLADFFGMGKDGCINRVLKRRDLAGLSNMSVSNAIRTLSALEKEGVVALKDKNIFILNQSLLEQIAAG